MLQGSLHTCRRLSDCMVPTLMHVILYTMHVIHLIPGVLVHVIVLISLGDPWLPYKCLPISSTQL